MERKLYMIHTQNEGIYRALIAQLDKLARHNRQESYKTRQRYYEAMQRFCRYLAEEYPPTEAGQHLWQAPDSLCLLLAGAGQSRQHC